MYILNAKNIQRYLISLILLQPAMLLSQIPMGYYDMAEGLNGSELKSALHSIVSDHIRYPYTSSSTDVWDILKETDEDPDSTDNVILIYTCRSQPKTANSGESSDTESNLWNREHIWSKSHGFPNEMDTAYTDCHHLRPADESVNSSRNELDFDNGGIQHVEATECYYDSDSWEPRDAVKGDVARMMFYMVVRYDPGYHSDNSLYDLELVDTVGTDTYQPTFGKLSALLQWHLQDPVDDFEQNRNEVVYGYQGNRNPFIDHPEWVQSIFASQIVPHTRIGFTNNSALVEEDAGNVVLELSIVNPDTTEATHCDIILASGDSSDLNGFTSASLTFPANSHALQTLEITVTDDELAEEQEIFVFSIINVSGGDSASVNGSDSFVLTIIPNDQISTLDGLIISEVMDGNRSGGQPKFLEITNVSTEPIAIDGLQIWRGSNGGVPVQVVSISSANELAGGTSWVVASSSGDMQAAGFEAPDQASYGINGNGNDVYELRSTTGEYIDAFGLVGTELIWYENSGVERIPQVATGQANYQADQWIFTTLAVGSPTNGSPGTPGSHYFIPVVSVSPIAQPDSKTLIRCYPNPFNGETNISFEIATYSDVVLDIYDIKGSLVTTLLSAALNPGIHAVNWNGTGMRGDDLASGIYFVRIWTAAGSTVQRISLLR